MFFEIGKWKFNSETNELVSGRKTKTLENRTSKVLEYLCQHPDRVITKDELLDNIWGRSALSEHSVAIVISDLRKALGDTAKNGRIIKTIPKKGYLYSPPASVKEQVKATLSLKWVGGFATALFALIFILYNNFIPEDPETVILYDVENIGASPDGEFLAESLTAILLAELSKIPDLRVIRVRQPEKPLLAGINPIENILDESQATLIGSISQNNDNFVFSIRLESGPENEILWGFNEELVEDYYYLSGQRAIQNLGSEMGWQTQKDSMVENERAERLFWRAVYLWESREFNDTQASHRTLLEALDIDPTFAKAHAQLATIYAHKTGPYLGFESPTLFDLAEQQIALAEKNQTDLPEINIAKALVSFYRDRDFETALGFLDSGVEHWPYHALLWQTRAMVTSAMGHHDESLFSIEKARRLDPLSHSINWDRVWFLYLAGQFEEALQAAEETGEFTADIHHYHIALIHEALGHKREAFNQWLILLKEAGIETPFTEFNADQEINYTESYKILLDTVEEKGIPFYPEAVKAFWAYLSGDEERTLTLLETIPFGQENWVYYWLAEIPLFSSLEDEERFVALLNTTL